jgi:hypothetical protein
MPVFGSPTVKDMIDGFYPFVDLHNPCGSVDREGEVDLKNDKLKNSCNKFKTAFVNLSENNEKIIWFSVSDGSKESTSNTDGNIYLELSDTTNFEISKESYSRIDYGDKIKVKVTAKKGSANKNTYLDVYADDWATSKRHCGKILLKVIKKRDKDQFNQEEIDLLINENENLVGNDKICFRVADKQLSKILNDSSLTIKSYFKQNSYTRAETIKSQGYINESKIFNQFIFKGGGVYEPKEYSDGNKKVFSEYFKKEINKRSGLHIYYFSLVKGYHVLTIVVNSKDPCKITFQIYDQIKIREEMSLDELDTEMLRLTNVLWLSKFNHVDENGKKSESKDSTEAAIWKIQRK